MFQWKGASAGWPSSLRMGNSRWEGQYSLGEKGGQAPVEGRGVHVPIVRGQEKRGLGFLVEHVQGGLQNRLVYLLVGVGFFQF